MEKTNLGISAALLGTIACLLGHFGGYVITGILVGYILLKEENAWLKKLSVKVIVTMLTFSVLSTLIYLIPNVLSTVHLYGSAVDEIFNFFGNLLSLLKTAVFLLMAWKALKAQDVAIPGLDKLLETHFS